MVDNVTETAARTTRSPLTDVPLVSRTKTEEANTLVRDEVALDSGTGIADEMKRQRVKGGGRKGKEGSIAQWALVGTTNASLSALSNTALNDQTRSQLQTLTDATRMVGGVLGTAGFVGFALQSAFLGVEAREATRRGRTTPDADADGRARTNGPDADPVRTRAANSPDAPATRSAAETAGRVAGEAAEEAVEHGAEAAARGVSRGMGRGLLRGIGSFFKKVPILGGVITAGFVVHEVAGFIGRGDTRSAFAAATAGGAEIAGSFVGFGVGDAAREGVRQAFVRANPEEYSDVAVSDIRFWAETGLDLAGVDVGAAFSNATSPSLETVTNVATRPSYDLALAHG